MFAFLLGFFVWRGVNDYNHIIKCDLDANLSYREVWGGLNAYSKDFLLPFIGRQVNAPTDTKILQHFVFNGFMSGWVYSTSY